MGDDESVRVVMEVLRKKDDYYAVLNVTKTAGADEIRRAYKMRALKLHPDKNKHPKAEEAFKCVSAAHGVLSDDAKRKVYDRHGKEGVQMQESGQSPDARGGFRHAGGGRQGHGFTEEEILQELFGGLFGGGGFGNNMRRRQQQQHYQQQQARQQQRRPGAGGGNENGFEMQFNGNPILAFLPFILFFVFALLLQSGSLFDTSDSNSRTTTSNYWGTQRAAQDQKFKRSLFRLARDNDFWNERHTTHLPDEISHLHVPYFVSHQFEQTMYRYNIPLRSLEMEVVRAKKESLERRCANDIQRGLARQKSISCQDLSKFKNVRSR